MYGLRWDNVPDTFSGYAIDSNTGILTPIAGSPFTASEMAAAARTVSRSGANRDCARANGSGGLDQEPAEPAGMTASNDAINVHQ